MKRRSPAKLARLLRVVRFQKEAQEVELARQRGRANEARSEIERLYSAAECAQVRPGSGHVGLALSGGGSRTAAACAA